MKNRQTVLIADDAEVNRSLLSDILSDDYDIVEVEDGQGVIEVLQSGKTQISLLLLDIAMPKMDGFEVLAAIRRNHYDNDMPVMIISAETSPAYIRKGFEMGVSDYISRPFDPEIVLQRVRNTIMLYSKQAQLKNIVMEQVREKEKSSALMVDILSTVVEFRNGESGLHVIRIRIITEILLEALGQRHPEYGLTPSSIALISDAAALHDIGKLTVPEEILNKPGRLTPEEFEVIKKHPIVADEMLKSIRFGKNEDLVQCARQICRWHHERWDGKGYPDGLRGDQIPIAAQAVALADVYDALTSQRVYKPAYPHEKAVRMILDGECGCFNPDLMLCLSEESQRLEEAVRLRSSGREFEHNISQISNEILSRGGSGLSDRTLFLLERERTKYQFLASISNEVLFDYDVDSDTITFSDRCREEFGMDPVITDCMKHSGPLKRFDMMETLDLTKKIESTTPQNPIIRERLMLPVADGSRQWYEVLMRSLWMEDNGDTKITGVIGKLANIHMRTLETSRLKDMAQRDPLTNLYNTAMARQLVAQSLDTANAGLSALVLFDLDHFKSANDEFGHLFGDRVLCYVAKLLESAIRKSDVGARVGGDEFLIFLKDFNCAEEIDKRCGHIFQALQGNCGGFRYTISMGVAVYPNHGRTYNELFHHADQALYSAKHGGRGRYIYYKPDLEEFASVISPMDSDAASRPGAKQ